MSLDDIRGIYDAWAEKEMATREARIGHFGDAETEQEKLERGIKAFDAMEPSFHDNREAEDAELAAAGYRNVSVSPERQPFDMEAYQARLKHEARMRHFDNLVTNVKVLGVEALIHVVKERAQKPGAVREAGGALRQIKEAWDQNPYRTRETNREKLSRLLFRPRETEDKRKLSAWR